MPELPEVEITRLGIIDHLLGQTIQNLTIRQNQLRWPISADLPEVLHDGSIHNVQRRGKYIIIHIVDKHKTIQGFLLVHLGMSGSLRIMTHNEAPQKHDHWDLLLSSGHLLRYNDPRRFGALIWINCSSPEALTQHPLLKKIGAEPFDKSYTSKHFYEQLKLHRKSIKAVLLEGKTVCGVGNIYASECLFLSNIHPTTFCNALNKEQSSKLLKNIRIVLSNAISLGGSTLKNFTDPHGNTGYFQLQTNVYGREHLPCHVCGTFICKMTQNQRASYYCPHCQPR